MTLLALCGWMLALGALMRCVSLARRLELVADAEHELRGPVTALSLCAEAAPFGAELDRLRIGLDDLHAARFGRRATCRAGRLALQPLVAGSGAAWRGAAERAGGDIRVDWDAGPVAVRGDRRRIAQALGNVLSNAVEHGGANVQLRGRRSGRNVVVEVVDGGPARGRGLAIAARAVEDAGGTLSVRRTGAGSAVALELPVVDA